jgi:hypothetical protein
MSQDKPWSGGGREELAAAVRQLMTATVLSTAPPDALLGAARQVGAVADALGRHVQAEGDGPVTRFADHDTTLDAGTTMAGAMPFDMVIGSCNPVALPIVIEFAPPKAIGRALFTPPYEGAPGCVHGAVLAGAFDLILTAANVMANAAGPTVELTIRYRKPTLIDQPALFEGWVTGQKGGRVHSQGQLIQDGVVTVEATGEFIGMDRSRIASMHRRRRRPAADNAVGEDT